jgi:hypothetical protein
VETNSDGNFAFIVPTITNNRPYNLEVLFQPASDSVVSFANFTRYVTIGGIFRVIDEDSSLSMGTALITYDDTQTYRDENIEFTHYDATT